ncbi:response regulator [Sphingomonas sp.]|uniref:response regulator n=1 Tax=Sphingomonas sp. TaxID=28214 RepID=UPI002E31C3DE|nr:response regulator [Sphingomonas sp.]HEX4695208.1 response regulator [Sphingomonas sp.]
MEAPPARAPLGPRVALGLALMLLILGVAVIFYSDHQYRLEQQQQIETQARVVASGIIAPLDFDDIASAQDYLSALSADPRVADATVRDRAGRAFVTYRRSGGATLATTATATVPVLRGQDRIGSVTLVETIDPLWRRLTRYSVLILLTVMAGLLVIVFAIGQAALHRANAALSQRARALGEANEALGREIEDRARAEDQLRQAQKMQALGQLTGGIAHDFNNLLTVVRGTADLLRRPGLAEARRMRYAESIAQVAERAAQLTSQLLAFSRRQPLHPEVVDLNARLQGMLMMFERLLGAQYSVDTDFDPGLCPVEVDPTQLEVAILNIVVNARDAMAEGGMLTVTTSRWPRDAAEDDQKFSAVSISDTGTGMDAETLARAMEPFFTTKIVGKGTGLGLSQVYGFATQSGGEVMIDSIVGRGATVRLILPCTTNQRMVEIGSASVPASGWRGRILFVEDNVEVAAFARTLLDELGHDVLYAQTGEAALELAARNAPFDLLFSDIVMPGMSGFDLAEEVRRLRPDVPILLTTGYSDRYNEEGSRGFPVLTKPYSLDQLLAAIEAAVGREGTEPA